MTFAQAQMSSSSFPFISIIRFIVLGVLTAFSVIVLGVSAHMLYVTVSTINFYWKFIALAVAIPVLTILTVVPAIIISLIMAMPPMFLLIESGWLAVLWVLWLASAAYTADSTILLPTDCNFSFFIDGKTVSCHEIQALEAFSWLNWLLLTAYVPTVFVLTVIAQSRSKNKPVQPVQPVAYPNQQQVYPPQQQPVYAPQPVYQQPGDPQQMSQQMPQQMQAQYAPATPPIGYATHAPGQAPVNPGYTQV